LIRAAEIVLTKRKDVCFLLFGEGKLKPVLEKMITKPGIEKNVVLAGFVKNPLGYMGQVDLVVNPSLTEGLPNVILEALALRKPVVATAVGGVPEIIQDGVTGYLVPPANPRQLAEKILFALDNPSLLAKATANGYRLLQEKFSLEAQTEKLQNLYRGLLPA
jgi:glycosyltransferase involved in cell wall biosynthesis